MNTETYAKIHISLNNILIPTLSVQEQLKKIAALENNWNENGAKQFSSKLIERVRWITQQLPTVPYIFPTAIGAIQIEYQKKDGSYLEFEIYEKTIKQYMIDKNGQELEREITKHQMNGVLQAVVDFYA